MHVGRRAVEKAREEVAALRAMLPGCPECRRIRTAATAQARLKQYINANPGLLIGHGRCSACGQHHPTRDNA